MEKRLLLGALALAFGVCGCGTPSDGGERDAFVADQCSCEGGRPDLGPEDLGADDLGADEGPVCGCSVVSTCCDGCMPQNPLTWCHAGGDQYGRCGSTGGCNLGAPGAPVTCVADACHEVDESALPSCVLVPANNGGACNDGDATTFGDTCDASGACAGTECVSELPCIVRTWNGSSCVDAVQTGETCDDGSATTHTDECEADGVCRGTACECSSGPCCDGCFFRGTDHVCEAGRVVETACGEGAGPSCGLRSVFSQLADVHCSGVSSSCDGSVVDRPDTVTTACAAGFGCFQVTAAPTGAACVECQ